MFCKDCKVEHSPSLPSYLKKTGVAIPPLNGPELDMQKPIPRSPSNDSNESPLDSPTSQEDAKFELDEDVDATSPKNHNKILPGKSSLGR